MKDILNKKKRLELELFLIESEIIKSLNLVYFDILKNEKAPEEAQPEQVNLTPVQIQEIGSLMERRKQPIFDFYRLEKELKENLCFSCSAFEVVNAHGIYYLEIPETGAEHVLNSIEELKIFLQSNNYIL
jgi:hypothetical protein